MFKKKTGKHASTDTFSLQTEISKNSPLTAAPAERYAFSLHDALGSLDDEEWYVKRLSELSNIIDETAGNYVIEKREVSSSDTLHLRAAPGGGSAVSFKLLQ